MNKHIDNNTSLFDAAFGDADNADKKWDFLSFTDRNPKTDFQYVGWVDVMGASHMMQRSLDAASKNVGCLHEAVLKACSTLKMKRIPELHPMADGVYIVTRDYRTIRNILTRIFRSYARLCLQIDSDNRLCPIRAAIAFGRIVNHDAYLEKILQRVIECKDESFLISYCSGILHGSAYVAAHAAECHAPPFGIFQDSSLREFGKIGNQAPVSWPLEKWWCEGHAANSRQRAFATAFGQRLLNHFEWMKFHPYDSGMSGEEAMKKIDGYKKQIEEYFGLCDKSSIRDGTQPKETKIAGKTKGL